MTVLEILPLCPTCALNYTTTEAVLSAGALLIAAATTVTNVAIILAIIFYPTLAHSRNFLILSLSMANFLIGALVIPAIAVWALYSECWSWGHTKCILFVAVIDYLLSSVIAHMAAQSVERYLHVCRPEVYKLHRKTILLTLFLYCWIVPLISNNFRRLTSEIFWHSHEGTQQNATQACAIFHQGHCACVVDCYTTFEIIYQVLLQFLLPVIMTIFCWVQLRRTWYKRFRYARDAGERLGLHFILLLGFLLCYGPVIIKKVCNMFGLLDLNDAVRNSAWMQELIEKKQTGFEEYFHSPYNTMQRIIYFMAYAYGLVAPMLLVCCSQQFAVGFRSVFNAQWTKLCGCERRKC
ncbi:trace amine-associated receptor 1-like [Paramacrobiotus metropolitanus]|uniref:trace amine-associated receptor 1-like n=1 Tax=Paramacrobiotus metropolitanus TaxID=2943436 RepID=UPI00244572C1|nr:trace amine-associated receptor 1-like [Paramacrobiotus metropolitanus]